MLFAQSSAAVEIIGGEISYTVRTADTPELISSRLGISRQRLIKENSLDPAQRLVPGTELKAVTRRIVPAQVENGIVINIPERMLYLFRQGRLKTYFPVGLGMTTSKTAASWKTPKGRFRIIAKQDAPAWYVPVSIQEEMLAEGKEVKTVVPPGPDNPLGRFAVRTSLPGIMIHETIHPATVHQFRSHGCIRVMPEHMELFFEEVEMNDAGELLYIPVKAARADDGRIYLEVHKDWYSWAGDAGADTRKLIESLGAQDRVDWEKIARVIRDRSGIAEDVTQ